ncbi:inhibitor of cysteine peptidase [Nocardia tenerifensis]|uniref:Inhibitor of cysteine peptidase n=1 Tax=Nocardia tenerifensis TaxID=228006 RepID=A0A318K5Q1_9NOCA|nr:protease inhibitor I42 family protein [Nocardia tenerifensis]PXX64254.1 inhibitor of cysteine peptidase [Nocardia tenerifensis]
MRKSLLVLLLGLAVAGCGDNGSSNGKTSSSAAPTSGQDPAPVTATEADDGQERRVAVGQTLVVTLPANPSTGYMWQIAGLDTNLLQAQGDPGFKPDPNVPVAPGSGGGSVWTFVGKAPGITTLSMDYLRPWEQGIEPAQKFSLTIKVE